MRILIDLQALQSPPNGNRGIGRYTSALVTHMLSGAEDEDEFILLLNGAVGGQTDVLRRTFAVGLPNVEWRVWTAPTPSQRLQTAEAIRAAVIADCCPDVVLLTSLFEGFGDDCVTQVTDCPTVVVLYDLIPYIFQDPYLENDALREWYLDKIELLKQSAHLLAISEASARDAVKYLGLLDNQVTNIGSDVDARFAPHKVDLPRCRQIESELGLVRPFLMYTGGIDHRKNIEGLISAFAKLPAGVIAKHQLAIVCSIRDSDRTRLADQMKAEGLPDDSVVFTGFVSDQMLLDLYNICRAFVFPSWYEGFGLPALEAMRCGAAVIGSNVSSLPEVIGRDDALFDPRSVDEMAGMIERVLTDDAFRQDLQKHAPIQAAKFDWADAARRTLQVLHEVGRPAHKEKSDAAANAKKPRLAMVSPLPPAASGISFYTAELLPTLQDYYDIELVVDQKDAPDPAAVAGLPLRSIDWFRDHAHEFDRVVYQFGNSDFHAHMFDLIEEVPGVTVLHDFFLSGIEAHMDPVAFTSTLFKAHGYPAMMDRYKPPSGLSGIDNCTWNWPVNQRALQSALGVIVHSEYARSLGRRYYAREFADNWSVIPLLRLPAELTDKAKGDARARLGIKDDDILICSFGHVSPLKRPRKLVEGLLQSRAAKNANVRLVFVGAGNEHGDRVMSDLEGSPLKDRVQVTGWAPGDLYGDYLLAADFAVQLRAKSRGETSAAVLDCQNHGLATIVNAHGGLAELPEDTVLHVPDRFSAEELAEAIDRLVEDENLRRQIGGAARALVLQEHAPEVCGAAYFQAIEASYRRHQGAKVDLYRRLVELGRDAGASADVAQAVADSLPPLTRRKQLFVDVSELARADANTGIQRVVKSVLLQWLKTPPVGWRVEPVYADPAAGRYRYAQRFTCGFLGIPDDWAEDALVDYWEGDHFVGLDLAPHAVSRLTDGLHQMAAAGVEISFVVYDLLPILVPQHFHGPTTEFARWFDCASLGHRLICISRSVASEVETRLAEHPPANGLIPEIGWFHLGADFTGAKTIPTDDQIAGLQSILSEGRPSFLMVGTVEPRKGHAFALDAFEKLWADGQDVNLVILGKVGWSNKELCERLDSHPERDRRLFVLNSASDGELEHLYRSCACLIAASEAEGFGLPLIEAAHYDLPILARDIPVFREVGGEFAAFFDGSSSDNLATAVLDWLSRAKAGKGIKSTGMPYLSWKESSKQLARALDLGRT
ncbi:MAG: glycosyltransferase [Marinibacterium sp.]|nr:glycosyltransferase [Marinibacterium sp.]